LYDITIPNNIFFTFNTTMASWTT